MSDSAFKPIPDEEWEALLEQLRAQAPVRPKPFFYARVSARLAAESRPRTVPAWLLRPAYAVLLAAVVLSLSGDGQARPPAAGAPAAAASRPLPDPVPR